MLIKSSVARQICTKGELDLVLAGTTRQIGTLSAAQLRSKITRARKLRDKWRDLAHEQTRTTKANDPGSLDDANQRSGIKAQLFDETLTRFEKRLAKLSESGSSTGAAKKPAEKSDRSSGRRAKRAAVREDLTAAAETINAASSTTEGGGKPASKQPADRKTRGKKSTVKSKAKKSTGIPKRSKPGKKRVARIRSPLHGEEKTPSSNPTDAVVSGKQAKKGSKRNLKATTAAKASAVKRGGATKITAHVSSRNRRTQASRNKSN